MVLVGFLTSEISFIHFKNYYKVKNVPELNSTISLGILSCIINVSKITTVVSNK